MTMQQNTGGGDGTGDGLERGLSSAEDTADLQEQEAPPELSPFEQLSALLDARLTPFERRIQAFTDRTANTLAGLEARIEAVRAQGGDTAELRDLVEDLHKASLTDDERKANQVARDLKKLERAQAAQAQGEANSKPKAEVRDDGGWGDWPQHADELAEFGRLRGFTAEEMAAAEWMPRLHGVGLAQEDFPEALPRVRPEALGLGHLLLGDQPAQAEDPPYPPLQGLTAGSDPHDGALLEVDPHPVLRALQGEDAGLALQGDELEDVGQGEVLEGPLECHHPSLRAARPAQCRAETA